MVKYLAISVVNTRRNYALSQLVNAVVENVANKPRHHSATHLHSVLGRNEQKSLVSVNDIAFLTLLIRKTDNKAQWRKLKRFLGCNQQIHAQCDSSRCDGIGRVAGNNADYVLTMGLLSIGGRATLADIEIV